MIDCPLFWDHPRVPDFPPGLELVIDKREFVFIDIIETLSIVIRDKSPIRQV
jgi:hypothetical protein